MLGRSNWLRVCLAVIATAVSAVALCQRPGDLVVTPTRLVLDNKSKAGDLTLLNRGAAPIRYRLSFVDMEMSEDGVLKRVETGSANSGREFLRLSPREVYLLPGESQRIKVLAVFPQNLTDGEFRSHLAFEPIATPKLALQQAPADSSSLRLNFEIRSVVTIPVVARNGRVSATASLSNSVVKKDAEGWFARFTLSRTGNRSIRGDVTVSFVPASGGAKITLGEISSLPVYFPNDKRVVTLRLTRDIAGLGKGEIEIRFVEPQGPKGAAAAKATAAIVK